MAGRKERILEALSKNLEPHHIEIEDESHMHSGPQAETHFKILVVSDLFKGQQRVERQRQVMEILRGELQGGLHALSQRALTIEEWEKIRGSFAFESPACQGGGKK